MLVIAVYLVIGAFVAALMTYVDPEGVSRIPAHPLFVLIICLICWPYVVVQATIDSRSDR